MNYLFPLGVRLTTWLTAAAFLGLAITRRDRRPLIAGFAWLAGYELAFQIINLIEHKTPLGLLGPVFFIVLGATVLAWAHTTGVRANPWLIAASLTLLTVWAATGFHLNGHQHGMFSLHTTIPNFNPGAELLNELSKTLWALAYLLPLWNEKKAPRPEGQGARSEDHQHEVWRAASPGQRAHLLDVHRVLERE